MADGSIKLKPTPSTYEQTQNSDTPNKSPSENLVEKGGFDITACVGSPEKPPSVEENISQTENKTDALNTTTSVATLNSGTNENNVEITVEISSNPVSAADN